MTAPGRFAVTVRKEDLVFAAAHFITLPGHRCESLHGHNYRVAVRLEGALDPEAWFVYDFVALKKLLRRLTDTLDHRVLLPTRNPKLAVREDAGAVTVAWDGVLRYRFPAAECVLLPIPNTTVEMLAAHLAAAVRDELAAAGARHLERLAVEVEENFGQAATYSEVLQQPGE